MVQNRNKFNNEKNLFVAEPLVRVASSWLVLEEIGDAQKAKELCFDALAGKKLYMTNAGENNHDYSKLYIVDSKNVWIVYVRKDVLCPGERYYSNR